MKLTDFYLLPADEAVMPFGKHRGSTIQELAESEPGYLQWLMLNSTSAFVQDYAEVMLEAIRKAALQDLDPMTLTDHQSEAVDRVVESIREHKIARLDGGAGVGKSYTTQGVVRALYGEMKSFAACAVSFVASELLRPGMDPLRVPVHTLARTLGFDKRFHDDGTETYGPGARTADILPKVLGPGRMLIVDEYSMVNDEIAQLIAQAAREHGGSVLFVGDQKQLPPVKQSTPSVIGQPWPFGVAQLTQSMRFAEGSPLHRIEQLVRNDPSAILNYYPSPEDSDSLMRVSKRHMLLGEFLANFEAHPDKLHRILAYTQRDVIHTNNQIRQIRYGPDAAIVEEDERLMIMATTDTPWVPEDTPKEDRMDMCMRYYSGTNFKAHHITTSIYEIEIDGTLHRIPHHVVRWSAGDEDVNRAPVNIVFASSESRVDESKLGGPEYATALKAARHAGLHNPKVDANGNRVDPWQPFKQLKGDFVWVGYTYCSTVHRIQGQTSDFCYVSPAELLRVGGIMGESLTYVATTRAREKLTLLI